MRHADINTFRGMYVPQRAHLPLQNSSARWIIDDHAILYPLRKGVETVARVQYDGPECETRESLYEPNRRSHVIESAIFPQNCRLDPSKNARCHFKSPFSSYAFGHVLDIFFADHRIPCLSIVFGFGANTYTRRERFVSVSITRSEERRVGKECR